MRDAGVLQILFVTFAEAGQRHDHISMATGGRPRRLTEAVYEAPPPPRCHRSAFGSWRQSGSLQALLKIDPAA